MTAPPEPDPPELFAIRCGYKDCSQVSDPQPTAEALEKWLTTHNWHRPDGQWRCWLCTLAMKPEQGRWGPGK